MHALTFLVSLVASQPVQGPAKFDVAPLKAKLAAVTDGNGHYLVYEKEQPYGQPLFYGDGKSFYRQRVQGGGASGTESFSVSLIDQRVVGLGSSSGASFDMKDSGGIFSVTCGKKETALKAVPKADLEKLLGGAQFFESLWTRRVERLLRDDTGTYYFVDRLRTEDDTDRRDFRLYVGQRGKMKQLPLKDVVDDTEGMIFSTKDGVLRLVASRDDGKTKKNAELKWVANKKELPLLEVPTDDFRNIRLIYRELGVYDGARLGSPCDDLQ
jgi:hypothetical protein